MFFSYALVTQYKCIFLMQGTDVKRLLVGIGYEIHDQELGQIASISSYVLRVSGYADLYNKLEDIMKLACHQQHPGKFAKPEENLMWEVAVNCRVPYFQIRCRRNRLKRASK